MRNFVKFTFPALLITLSACGNGGWKPLSDKIISNPIGFDLNCKTGAIKQTRNRGDLPEIKVGKWYEYEEFVELTANNKDFMGGTNNVHKDIVDFIGQYCTRNPGEL